MVPYPVEEDEEEEARVEILIERMGVGRSQVTRPQVQLAGQLA